MRETWADIPLGIKGSGGKQGKGNKIKGKSRKIKVIWGNEIERETVRKGEMSREFAFKIINIIN